MPRAMENCRGQSPKKRGTVPRKSNRKTDEVCYIVTVRRCSMLLDDNAMSELNSVE